MQKDVIFILFFFFFWLLGMKTHKKCVRNSAFLSIVTQGMPREQAWFFPFSDQVLLISCTRNTFQIRNITLKQKVIVLQI